MTMKRFVVAGHSMLPSLKPGVEVVASSSLKPVPGDIVAFPDPSDAGQWLIKRLANSEGVVTSDNPDDSSHDSTDFGPIDLSATLTVVSRLDDARFVEACGLLAAEDDALARLVDRWGIPDFWARSTGFATLVLLILEQQVSLESGAAMYRRLKALIGHVTPSGVEEAGVGSLRSIGVTRQKAAYIIGLAEAVSSGRLDLESLDRLTAEQARTELISLKGIGHWTADAYLLSAGKRTDMWPVGDRALQVGAGEALGMTVAPTESELEIIGEAWRPIRAAAARLIWHAYLSERGRTEPPDPTL